MVAMPFISWRVCFLKLNNFLSNRSLISKPKRNYISDLAFLKSTPNGYSKKNMHLFNYHGVLNQKKTSISSYFYIKNFHTEGFQSKSANLSKFELYKESSFDEAFQAIVECTTSNLNQRNLYEVTDWLERVLNYNVPHGKKNRGIALVKSYQIIASKQDLTKDNIFLAQLLGWCIEMCQAFLLVLDDIMDQSVTRRGRPCWYKNEGIGLIGINDGLLLEHAIYVVLKSHFSDNPYYCDIVEAFHEVQKKISWIRYPSEIINRNILKLIFGNEKI